MKKEKEKERRAANETMVKVLCWERNKYLVKDDKLFECR